MNALAGLTQDQIDAKRAYWREQQRKSKEKKKAALLALAQCGNTDKSQFPSRVLLCNNLLDLANQQSDLKIKANLIVNASKLMPPINSEVGLKPIALHMHLPGTPESDAAHAELAKGSGFILHRPSSPSDTPSPNQ